jgi:hypothetical protein
MTPLGENMNDTVNKINAALEILEPLARQADVKPVIRTNECSEGTAVRLHYAVQLLADSRYQVEKQSRSREVMFLDPLPTKMGSKANCMYEAEDVHVVHATFILPGGSLHRPGYMIIGMHWHSQPFASIQEMQLACRTEQVDKQDKIDGIYEWIADVPRSGATS